MWRLTVEDLPALELGARFLGSGGAGDPRLARMLVEAAWPAGAAVDVVDAAELPASALVLSTGLVGSVTAFSERPAGGDEFSSSVTRLRTHIGSDQALFVAPYECAGVNALLPVLVALQLGVPLVDVDGMGRGLSWMDQTTYGASGLPICPMVVTAPAGAALIFEDTPAPEAERYIRSLAFQMGGWAAFAGYPLSRVDAVSLAVHGALSRALRIGRTGDWRAMTRSPTDPARLVSTGRVTEVRWAYPPGYPRLTAVVLDPDAGPVRIEASNEFLLVVKDGVVQAEVPAIICVVDLASGRPILTERVRVGMAVAVVALDAPDPWSREDIRAAVSLARFGIDVPAAAR